MRICRVDKENISNILENLLKRSPNQYGSYQSAVDEIVADVRENGDAALFAYAKKFDKADLTADNLCVTEEEIKEAYDAVDPSLVEVIRRAGANIRAYHERQKRNSWFESQPNGIILGQKVTALASVGIYVPGGKASYPSTVLMNTLPAKVAGVGEIVMATPAGADGKVNPVTLVAAHEAGADIIYKVGGAQAIAAMAYGTESVKK